jgi:ArsR family transcriptional regulator, arsenate/arsenite/antimonite-responsive transcriptional repressor
MPSGKSTGSFPLDLKLNHSLDMARNMSYVIISLYGDIIKMQELAKILKAIGDRNRFRIVKMLEKKPLCVCEIKKVLGLAQSSVSKHLKILKGSGLVSDEQDGFWTNYRLNTKKGGRIAEILSLVKGWGNDNPVIISDREKAWAADRLELCCNGNGTKIKSEKPKVKNKKAFCLKEKPDQNKNKKDLAGLDASSWLGVL